MNLGRGLFWDCVWEGCARWVVGGCMKGRVLLLGLDLKMGRHLGESGHGGGGGGCGLCGGCREGGEVWCRVRNESVLRRVGGREGGGMEARERCGWRGGGCGRGGESNPAVRYVGEGVEFGTVCG